MTKDDILKQIIELENQITARNIQEAICGDKTAIEIIVGVRYKIEQLRLQLKN